MNNSNTVCVTGAGGFVGGALCKTLLEKGFEVRAIGRKSYPELLSLGAKIYSLDIKGKKEALIEAFHGSSAVFHVAAKVDMWGPYQEFFRTNVSGTRNVIAACKEAGVSKLIYTSSPSVVADGKDLRNINETYPIPEQHQGPYPATKAIAEAEVLANNSANLKTIALRPHLIFGPGDNHFIPTIIERAKQGRLLIVGSGKNLVDLCFIDDCVQAHLAAFEALTRNPSAAGKAFFISQGEPIKLWEFIDRVLKAHGLATLSKRVPKSIAMALAGLFEIVAKISPLEIKPQFTRFLVSEMTTDHYFDISAAREILGFIPRYSLSEAIELSFSAARPPICHHQVF